MNYIILDDPTLRNCEIYKITNLVNNKIYVGQAVSHILNHKRYRPYGHVGRFKTHISEAYSTKKNKCHYLNNAILKYGADKFKVEVIESCKIEDADVKETHYILECNSLYPTGYNLKTGGKSFQHTNESKMRVSNGVARFYEAKKYEKFKNIDYISDDIDQYIKPLKKYNEQYGWYVYINKIKADFGGIYIPLDVSKNNAIYFIMTLKNNLAKHLDAGSSLEPLLPLTFGNICEELV